MSHRLTGPAERDILDILRATRTMFGTAQLRSYAALIDKAILMVAENPDRPGMLPRPELGPDVRLFHLNSRPDGEVPPPTASITRPANCRTERSARSSCASSMREWSRAAG